MPTTHRAGRVRTGTKKERMYAAIEKHGRNLQAIFPKTRGLDPVALCKKLLRLENEAHHAAERYSSVPTPAGYWETAQASVLKRLDKILGFKAAKIPVFVNGDPRGYALKIDDGAARDMVIYRDMGGYGILAPDFREG